MSEINVAQPALSQGSATLPRMRHLLGYVRVSTSDQQPYLHVDALKTAGCYRAFTETASGVRIDRPTFERSWTTSTRQHTAMSPTRRPPPPNFTSRAMRAELTPRGKHHRAGLGEPS